MCVNHHLLGRHVSHNMHDTTLVFLARTAYETFEFGSFLRFDAPLLSQKARIPNVPIPSVLSDF